MFTGLPNEGLRFRTKLLLVALAASACSGVPDGSAAQPAGDSAGSAVRTGVPRCEAITGLAELLTPGNIILLGEIHGTREAPAFLAKAVCLALSKGLNVTVGLELPADELDFMDRYLASAGSASDQAAFLRARFWAKDYQDGRSSRAMLALVEQLRSFASGVDGLRVILIDQPDAADRDGRMAARVVAEAELRPSNLFLILTGNVHNRVSPDSRRMGTRVVGAVSPGRVVSLNMLYATGTAWLCLSGEPCGVRSLQGKRATGSWAVRLTPSTHYDGVYSVGAIHASLPAR